MEYYGKQAELKYMMQQWCSALMRHMGEAQTGADKSKIFRQQMDPLTGDFTQDDPGGYSPCALTFLDFARRLSQG
jgi:hypothetical protein